MVFWIASKKLGLISSTFWPKCISTHWLETWIEIYCLNFNNFCSNWEGRGLCGLTPPTPTGEVKTMEFRGGVSYQQVRNIFFGKFLPFFVKLYVLLKSAENFVNLSKVQKSSIKYKAISVNVSLHKGKCATLHKTQGCNARRVNCSCVYSAYILKPVLSGRNL